VGHVALSAVPGSSPSIPPVTEPSGPVAIEVRVELKPGIADPEAESIEKSLRLLGVPEISRVATARIYVLEFQGVSSEEAERLTARAVDRLLANPVIHRVTTAPARRP
jgi:phosphoribosylformylglycinamidine synthase PurS subunit